MSDEKAKKNVTVRTRKFKTNKLLRRKQMILDVIHPNLPNVPKTELQTRIGKVYHSDPANVVLFGFKTHFGGGKSTGFCLIYDDQSSLKEFEPKYRLVRAGLAKAKEGSRKQKKERKNRQKKLKGTKKASVSSTATKKAAKK